MPYVKHEDHIANQRWKYEQKQLRRFRSMGLEPVDLKDNLSDLRCEHCGKVSKRNSPHMFRHDPECPSYSPRYWSRKKEAA